MFVELIEAQLNSEGKYVSDKTILINIDNIKSIQRFDADPSVTIISIIDHRKVAIMGDYQMIREEIVEAGLL